MTIFAKLTVSWFARVREKRSGLPRARNLSGFLSKAGAFLSGFIFFAAHFAAVKQDKKSSLIKPPFGLSAKLAPRSSPPAKFASPLPVLHLFPNALPPCPLLASARFCLLCQARFLFAPARRASPLPVLHPARRVRRRFVLLGFSFAAIWPLLGKNARS